MLTALASTLLLTTLLQDAPAAAPESGPAESDPKAVTLLEEFDAMLYKPEEHGLETLAFDLEIPGQMGGRVGVLSVTWSKADGASGSLELEESMKAMIPEAALGQMEEQMGLMATQIAAIQTNRLVSDLLEDTSVSLEGVEDGYVKIVATPLEEGAPVRTLLFEDGRLGLMKQTMTGPMGMELENTGTMTWTTVGDTDLLVLASSVDTQEGSMGTREQSQVYRREDVGGFTLVTAIDGEAMGQSSTLAFSNFVVNGEAVGGGADTADTTDGETADGDAPEGDG